MKGNDEVLALLNELLAHELTATNQYLLHAKTCKDWGYARLGEKLDEQSADELGHANMLIERILFLEGKPNMQHGAIEAGQTVKAQLEIELRFEHAAIAKLNDGIAKCRACGDNATEDLLTKIVVSEQDDTQWIESQLELMRQVGEQNYLAQHLK